jgi:hypothetical protein
VFIWILLAELELFAIQTLDGRLAARSTLRLATPDADNIA